MMGGGTSLDAQEARAIEAIRQLGDFRDKLRELIDASDALDRACVEWEAGDHDADIDAAKLRFEAALAAARGAL